MGVVVTGSASPTPGTSTFATLKSRVARYVLSPDSSDVTAIAADAIRDAVNEINTRRWNWNLVYQDVVLVADDADYDLATPFKGPFKAELLDSNNKCLGYLGWMDNHQFLREYSQRDTSGDPYHYTVENPHEYGQVVLSAPPSSSFVASYPTLRLWFYRRVQPQVYDSDLLDIPSEVESYIEWQAKAYLASEYDPSKLSYAQSRADRLWAKLQRDDVTNDLGDWSD